MAVRNFYLEAEIDGRKTGLHGGPQGKKGGMQIHLYQRDKGQIKEVASIWCYEKDGTLRSEIFHNDTSLWIKTDTERD